MRLEWETQLGNIDSATISLLSGDVLRRSGSSIHANSLSFLIDKNDRIGKVEIYKNGRAIVADITKENNQIGGAIKVMSLYPNPCISNFKVDVKSFMNTSANIKIFTQNGRVVSAHKVDLHQGNNVIDLSKFIANLVAGTYQLQIDSELYKTTKSFVKL